MAEERILNGGSGGRKDNWLREGFWFGYGEFVIECGGEGPEDWLRVRWS